MQIQSSSQDFHTQPLPTSFNEAAGWGVGMGGSDRDKYIYINCCNVRIHNTVLNVVQLNPKHRTRCYDLMIEIHVFKYTKLITDVDGSWMSNYECIHGRQCIYWPPSVMRSLC